MASSESFSTAIICMDGRVQQPAHAFIQAETNTQYTDTITRPGIEKQLDEVHALELDHPKVQELKTQLTVSTLGHNSEGIVIAKHEECLGNPITDSVDEDEKTRQMLRGATLVERINSANGVGDLPIFTIGVRRSEAGLWIAEKTVFQPTSARNHEIAQVRKTVRANQLQQR